MIINIIVIFILLINAQLHDADLLQNGIFYRSTLGGLVKDVAGPVV